MLDSKLSEGNKAIVVAASWAASWGLKVVVPKSRDGVDLLVEGRSVKVCLGDKCSSPCSCSRAGAIVLQAKKLNSRRAEDAVEEMWAVTTAVGRGRPTAFRKTSKVLRASSDDYEATSLRLTPFQRVPNPRPAQLKEYEPIVRREANRAAKRYRRLLQQMSMDEGDLYTAGLVYLCNYLHHYQNLHDGHHNGANLTLSLKQEFRRWASVTFKKLKGITLCPAGVPVSEMTGTPMVGARLNEEALPSGESRRPEVSYSFDLDSLNDSPEPPEPVFADEGERGRHERRAIREEARFVKARQAAHAKELEDLFDGMTHDAYVEALSGVINQERHPIEAREEASRRMEAHRETCRPCRCADEAWTEVMRQRLALRCAPKRRRLHDAVIPTIDDVEEATS